MPRPLSIDGVLLHANATPCAYHCRYCQLGSARTHDIPFARFESLVLRFIDWRATHCVSDFGIYPWFGNAYEHGLPTLEGIIRLGERLGGRHEALLLGGLRHRPMDEMRTWLEARRELGIVTLVATFSGHDAVHDHWNHQPGNYRFQLDCLHLAAQMGMKVQQRILLMRSNLPTLDRVLDDLDSITAPPERVNRWAIPMFYSGRARRLESERLTEDDFASLSPRQRAILREDAPHWRSERRWAEHVEQEAGEEPHSVSLTLDMTPAGLDWAEVRSCDEIVETLQRRYLAAAHSLPSRRELCARHADRSNERVYFNLPQMERLWMERHLAINPADRKACRLLFP